MTTSRVNGPQDIIKLLNDCTCICSCPQNALIALSYTPLGVVKICDISIKNLKSYNPDEVECDIITNFRDSKKNKLPQLRTTNGRIIKTPNYWSTANPVSRWNYALPADDVIVDAYVLRKELRKELIYLNLMFF